MLQAPRVHGADVDGIALVTGLDQKDLDIKGKRCRCPFTPQTPLVVAVCHIITTPQGEAAPILENRDSALHGTGQLGTAQRIVGIVRQILERVAQPVDIDDKLATDPPLGVSPRRRIAPPALQLVERQAGEFAKGRIGWFNGRVSRSSGSAAINLDGAIESVTVRNEERGAEIVRRV